MKQIITISRQYGSGGRIIGQKTAELLGIPCYDSKIIEKLAEKTGLRKDFVEDSTESSDDWMVLSFSSKRISSRTIQNDLWNAQCDVIRQLAEKPCVIVGRGADFILKDRTNLLKVFIFADRASRIRRVLEEYHESPSDPEKYLREKDRGRQTYYQSHAGMTWGDSSHYDLALSSSGLGIEPCVEILTELYRTL
ncbi:cytidylate kinase-like family protein [Erysipelotrichaceae bacterium Oil+RF-744-GAM-WT-6]|uniref:Cytidylate kinase-like family protein n=1 Tax=Stecheria intestinalis TaxID=2606630 RepID=A0A7X2TG92_9FIRM|nr:cytidylate kinase-like family protein [Stecheria intestinalis]MSS58266.1 cytidylate kinase-like family protein [Stecheria intestinalis]